MTHDEPLVFGPTVEGLFVRGLAGKLTPDVVQRLRAVGLDVEKPLLPAYSRRVINDAVALVAQALYPELPVDEAWYQVGKHVAVGVKNMTLGGATLALLRILGPVRTLHRLARTFRTTNNYMQVRLTERGPGDFELELTPSNAQPRYMQAVIEDMLTYAGAKGLAVEVAQHDAAAERAVYTVRFDR